MDENYQRRMAANEALFREANEATEQALSGDEDERVTAFRCECAALDCELPIELTLLAYERVRAYPRRFFVFPGHECADIETTVEARSNYLVVEKRDEGGRLAEATDPRV